MICYIFDNNHHLLREEERIPVCGEDFCDSCGDCLSCSGGDPCMESSGGEHYWVRYEDDNDA